MRVLACLLLALVGCTEGPTDDQCNKLRDHLIDLQAKEAGGTALTPAQVEDAHTHATKVRFMPTCTDKTTKKLVECALAATTTDEARACDESKKANGSGS